MTLPRLLEEYPFGAKLGNSTIHRADPTISNASGLPRSRDAFEAFASIRVCARVSAVANLDGRDCFQAGHRWQLRLQEKGGKRRDLPVHHKAGEYLDAYLDAAGVRDNKDAPLFQSLRGRTGELTGRRLQADNILQMVKRRAQDAGFDPEQVCCHTFRGTGITTYLENGGKLETAQQIAGHNSATTTKLFD